MPEIEPNMTTDPPQTPNSSQTPVHQMEDTLVQEHYGSVHRFALASLRDVDAARRVTLSIFTSALLDSRRPRTRGEIKLWLYSLALRIIRSEERRIRIKPVAHRSPDEWENRLWHFVDSLGTREHELCLLYYLLGFRVPETASLLHVSQGAVHAQLEIFRGKFRQIMAGASFARSEEAADIGIIGGPTTSDRSVEGQRNIETRIVESLQRRWPEIQLSSDEMEQVIAKVRLLAEKERLRQQKIAPYRRLAIAGGIVILVSICLGLGVLALLSSTRLAAITGKATQWDTKSGAPLVEAKALSRSSDPETIRQRLQEGPLLWKTLWLDVQFIAYGPQSYIGLPKFYRAQAWISQPDQSLELFGLLSETPSSLHMVEGGRSFYLNPVLQISTVEEWKGNPPKEYSGGKLLSNAVLRNMVFPGSGDARYSQKENGIEIGGGIGASWSRSDGTFRTIKYEQVAGRRVLVVDWMNQKGRRENRLWLDVHTGLILHLQKYGGADFQTLTFESIVTEIAYNQTKPPPQFSDALQLKEPDDFLEWMNLTVSGERPMSTPTIAAPLIARSPISPDPVPTGYDPTNSSLIFQLPLDPDIMNSITHTAEIPTGLIADGYLLDVIKFGLPWVLRCNRSPDGQRLAFNTGTDGTAPADDSLRWFNLKEPQAIYQPLRGLHATSFSFAPDSHRLAIFSYGEGQYNRGIYLLDIGTGEYEFLMSLADARSMVWSPDGEYLALIGSTLEDNEPTVLVIHVPTAQISYRAEIVFLEGVTYVVGPMSDWGVEFPVEMGGMDECAAPP